ncbi:MAG: InlB B-repeat-containing protein, partial [Bacilli bacterium]|nr:InlB B-repeat-containing protein [Bacilli bacterium]
MKKKLSLIFVFMFMLLGLIALNTKPVMAASETEVEAELNNIVLPDKAIIDFPVVSVSVYGSTIEWKSDRTDVISVPTNGGWTTVKRQNVDVTVTLTVTLTNGEIVKTKDFEVKVPKGTTLTNTYKIEYVLNGGTNNAQNPTEYKVGETKELLAPTKGEVEFLGWFNNEKFEGEAITSLPKGLSGDYKLYAKWTPATVTGIEVTTLPTTVNYKALETFDKTGLVVSKLLNDGTKEVVALEELTFDKDVLHFGDDKVVVKWNEFTTEFAITVAKKDYDLSGIKFENAALTYNGQVQTINYTGDLLDGLTATVEGSATNVTKTPVTITLVFTNTNADYNTPENMTAELTITKAPLKVIASSASIKVGEDVPTFTASYDGFVNGETEKALGGELTITCSATKTSPAGSYAVIPAGLTAENYEIEFVNGTLTIASGTYTIVASNTKVTYNGENQMFTVVLKDGETVIEGITFTYTLNDAAFTGATNAGTYEVTVSYDSETYGKGSTVVTFVIDKANYNL